MEKQPVLDEEEPDIWVERLVGNTVILVYLILTYGELEQNIFCLAMLTLFWQSFYCLNECSVGSLLLSVYWLVVTWQEIGQSTHLNFPLALLIFAIVCWSLFRSRYI